MSKGQEIIIIEEDIIDPVVDANQHKNKVPLMNSNILPQDYFSITAPYFPYFPYHYFTPENLNYASLGLNRVIIPPLHQKPSIPVVQKKLTEEEKIIDDAIYNYYQKYSKTHKICGCESCEKLTLPFLIKYELSKDEKLEAEKSHKDYLDDLISRNEALGIENSKKLNNVYTKNIYLGEVKFKISEN